MRDVKRGAAQTARLYDVRDGVRMSDAENERADTLLNVLRTLRRRWFVLITCIVGCAAIAVALHERAPKDYEATASVAFNVANLSDNALEVANSGSDPARDAATNVLIARSEQVADAVVKQLALPNTPQQALAHISVEAAPNADILNITAKDSDAATARVLANAFAKQYIAFQAKTQTDGITQAESSLREQLTGLDPASSRATAISASLQRLAQLRAVANGNARVIGQAGVGTLAGTGLKVSLVLGALLGAAIGIAFALIIEALDRRVTRIEDFERGYRLPALTAVPQSAFREQRAADRTDELEPYRILRSVLDVSTIDQTISTLLVTSAVPGEGKTSAAVDLAQAVALTGRSVTLVELDLRRPTFSRHFDVDPRRGVTTILSGSRTLEEVLVRPIPALPTLAVLPSGQLPPNPSELLGLQKLEDLLTRLTYLGQGEGRMIIIDAPPLLPVADAQVLLNNQAIDKVLVVSRAGKTTREEIRRARTILDRHLIEPVGVVVTGVRDSSQYGYEPLEDVAGPPTANGDGRAPGAPPRSVADRVAAASRRSGS
jgi:capsular exopolysaccharide synthesis family protein